MRQTTLGRRRAAASLEWYGTSRYPAPRFAGRSTSPGWCRSVSTTVSPAPRVTLRFIRFPVRAGSFECSARSERGRKKRKPGNLPVRKASGRSCCRREAECAGPGPLDACLPSRVTAASPDDEFGMGRHLLAPQSDACGLVHNERGVGVRLKERAGDFACLGAQHSLRHGVGFA